MLRISHNSVCCLSFECPRTFDRITRTCRQRLGQYHFGGIVKKAGYLEIEITGYSFLAVQGEVLIE